MKKTFSLLFVLILLLSLAGCARLEKLEDVELPPLPDVSVQVTPEPAPEPSAVLELPEDTEPESFDPSLSGHVIVSISSNSEDYMDPQNGTERILSFSWDTPYIYIEGDPEASQEINEYIATLDETYYTGNDYGLGTATGLNFMLELATDQYTHSVNSEGEFVFTTLSCTRTANIMRADEGFISLMLFTREYTGGDEGTYYNRAYNFDPADGSYLGLEELGSDVEELKAFISSYILSHYNNDSEGMYSELIDNAVIDTETAFSALLRDGSWYLNDLGMIIFSDPYELDSDSSASVEFLIPYSELEVYLKEQYLPPEKGRSGSFSLIAQSDMKDGSTEVIDRVVIDEEGMELCLVAEGIVYDVRLSSVTYSDRFYETAQRWACSYMQDCVLQLTTLIPEGMPDLMLSYSDGSGEKHNLLLTQSGEDGSLILVDDDIEAVG